mgnify:CR=1 FL=1
MAKDKKNIPKSKLCPLCNNYMDIYCTGHKNVPFVDGKCYPKLCFVCYHVPKTEVQIYNEDGSVKEDRELPYTHKHLHTMAELVEFGMAQNAAEARDSVKAVRAAINAADILDLQAIKKKPKDKGVEIDTDPP